MYTDLMLDLETLDTTPRAAVLSIAAVAFNRSGPSSGGQPLPYFYRRCKPDFTKYATAYDTFEFWMKQSDAARQALFVDAWEMFPTLDALAEFYRQNTVQDGSASVWCLPGSFDLPILENAFRVESVRVPWKYDAVACLRTAYKLAGITKEDRVPPTLAHDALSDAISQIETLRKALQRISVRSQTV